MKKEKVMASVKPLFNFFGLMLFSSITLAQAPVITYSPSTNVFTVGSSITNLTPLNSGGAVPANAYGTVSTFAGSLFGTSGRTNLTGTAAKFNSPNGITINSSGTMFIADNGNNEIRQITSAAAVTLFAGSSTGGTGTTNNNNGTSAKFDKPNDITTDGSGNMYVADLANNEIRKITPGGAVTLLAGSTAGTAGTTNNTGTSAKFRKPSGIIYDPVSGDLYVADFGNNEIRRVTTAGAVTLLAGSTGGTAGRTNASGTSARFDGPESIAVDASGNLFVADENNNEIREVTPSGVVTLFAGSTAGTSGSNDGTGTGARFNGPSGITIDAIGNLYVSDGGNNTIRMITPAGVVTTIAGDGTANYTDAVGTAAEFDNPQGLDIDPTTGNIFVTDNNNNVIREIINTGYSISPALPAGLVFDSTTGIISGTPTAVSSAASYTITAYNLSGSSSTTVTISCVPASPTGTNGVSCGSSSVTLTASGSLPAGGTYRWYAALTGGAALATGSTYSPSPGSTTTYYVDYTSGGVTTTPRVPVTATIQASPAISAAPTTPSGSLTLSYSFSGNANDISGNGNNGTVQGAAPLAADRYGASNSAYSFNGSTQYISTATPSASPGPQTFSISIWFKTSTGGGKLIGYGASQTGASSMYDRHIYMSNTGQIYYGIYPNAVQTINTTTTYADGLWHHVVATTSTTNGSNLYVDGALKATDPTMTTSQVYGVNGYWRVGYDNLAGWTNAPTNSFFTGSLDDIAVYNTELTASQVYALYGAGSTPACVGNALTLQVNTVAGATYSWSGPGGYSSNSQSPTVSASATTAMAGTYTCVVSAAGCSSTIKVTAVVNSLTLPTSTFSVTSPVDVGANSTITYTGVYSATSTYVWNFNGGTVVSGSGVGPYTVQWATSGAKTVTLTVTNSSGCNSASTQSVLVNGTTYGNYAFRKLITLNTTSLGITSNLTSFPALLSIQDNNLIISGTCADKVVNPNGPNYDFAFVDANTPGELNYQVESYDQTTGTLLVWVQIPTLTYATNNTLSFFYGSSSPTVTHNTAFFQGTWAGDYQAVFHFNESAYTGTVIDGTAGGHTSTTSGMTTANLVTGKIGKAYAFSGAQAINSNAVTVTGPFTISAWVKMSSVNTDQKIMTNQAAAGGSTGGYKMGIYSDNTPESESGSVVNRTSTPTPSAFTAGVWHYVQGIYTGSTLSTYIDGAQYKILNTTNSPTSTTPLYIGVGEGGAQYYFNGTIDEVRVSNVAKSADWIKAEYGDQNNPVTFTIAGAGITVNNTVALTIPGSQTYTWTGAANTNTANANNWNNTTAGTTNQLPAFNGSETIVIPSGLTNYPSLTASAGVYGLTIANGASLNLNGFTLSVGCNIYNSQGGQLLYGSTTTSGLTWNGTAASQTYTGSNTTNTASLGSMTINNSSDGTVTISSGPVDIYNTLTITNGNLAIGSSPAALTLKSTATQTASVAALPTGSAITGTVNVERYISGGSGYRSYRLISSPVYNAAVSSNNVYNINYLQGGMYLTGAAGGGFDKTGNPTIYLFREDQVPSNLTFTSGNFWGISAINNAPSYNYYLNGIATSYNIPVGNGTMFFFRGNRASAALATETLTSYTTPIAATLSTSGTLNQGQVVVHDWYNPGSPYLGYTVTTVGSTDNSVVRGFNLVGNPYASSIDWEQFNTTSTTTGIYANNLSTTYYELNPVTKNFDTYQKGGAFTNNASNIIASGQGFFVLAGNNTNPQLIFNETAKTSAQKTGLSLYMSSKATLAAVKPNVDQHLRLQLAKDSINTDDIYIGFNSGSDNKYIFNEDAPYRPGSGEVSLASVSSDSVTLAINRMPLPKQSVSVPLTVHGDADGIYKLNMTELNAVPQVYEIWLMDHYKNDSLDMRHNQTYAFNIYMADTSSYGSKRFSLVIRQNPALGVHLLNFAAAKATNGAQVAWTTENEQNYTNFTVERSSDGGKTFTVLGGFASNALGNYNFLDKNPPVAADKYRLKIEDMNGAITYSAVVTLMYANSNGTVKGNSITIYPNPAKSTLNLTITPAVNTNTLSLSARSAANALYSIKVVNNLGSVVKSATTAHQNWQTDVSSLMPGTYVIQVINSTTSTIVGEGTFIKL